LILVTASSAEAVILYRSAIRNKSAPTGTDATAGGNGRGTGQTDSPGRPSRRSISSRQVTSAAALGRISGINGTNHLTTQTWDDPVTDLRVFKISDFLQLVGAAVHVYQRNGKARDSSSGAEPTRPAT